MRITGKLSTSPTSKILNTDNLLKRGVFLTQAAESLLRGLSISNQQKGSARFGIFSPYEYLRSVNKVANGSEPKLMRLKDIFEIIKTLKLHLIPPGLVPTLCLRIKQPKTRGDSLIVVATIPLASGGGEQFLFALGNSINFKSLIEISGDPDITYYSDRKFLVML